MRNFIVVILLLFLLLGHNLLANFNKNINEGNKYYKKHKYEESLELYRKAQMQKPDSAIVNFNIGNSLYKQQLYEESIKEYEKSYNFTKDKNFKSNILHNIGNAYYKMNNYDQAKDYYKRSLIENPNNNAARYNLQQILLNPILQQEKKQDKKHKDDKQQQKNDDKKQEEKKGSQEQKKYMSEQDVHRLIEMLNQKDKKDVIKKQKPKLPEVEKDW